MTSAVNVLLVETDEPVLREWTDQLLMDGYAVDAVSHIDQARDRLAEHPDALVLSGEPDTIGLLRQVRGGEVPRADCRLPVLVVGVDDASAAVRYYRAGADVALPSESSGLLVAAGLEALVRRAGPAQARVLRVGSLTVDQDARTASVDGRPVTLTRLEFDLLATLAGDPRRTFTRAELTREVWNYDPQAAGPSRTVDSHVISSRDSAVVYVDCGLRPACRRRFISSCVDSALAVGAPPPIASPDRPHRAVATQPTCRRRPWSTTIGPNASALEISHAHRLRQKLEQAGAESMVQTVRGVGWRLTR